MKATDVLREQLRWAHGMVEQALDDLPFEHLHHKADGATIQSIATIYAHVVSGEDALINQYVLEEEPLLVRDGWLDKVGIDFSDRSLEGLAEAVNGKEIDALREYAQAVYAHTDVILSKFSDEDLDRTITFGPMGDMPLGVFLANIVGWHYAQHGGEICALIGIQGGRGLPF